MRVHRWAECGLISNPRFSLSSLRVVLAAEANYEACSGTLATLFSERPQDYLDVAQHYHGARSPYYAWLVRLGTMLLGLGVWTHDLGVTPWDASRLHGIKVEWPDGDEAATGSQRAG